MSENKRQEIEQLRRELRARTEELAEAESGKPELEYDAGPNEMPRISPANLRDAERFTKEFATLNSAPEEEPVEDAPEDPYDQYQYNRTRYDTVDLRKRVEGLVDDEQISLTQHLLRGYVTQDVPLLFSKDGSPSLWARIRSGIVSDTMVAADAAVEILKDRGVGASALSKVLVQQALYCCRVLGMGPSMSEIEPVPVGDPNASLLSHESSKKELKRVLAVARYFLDKSPPQVFELVETNLMWFDERIDRVWKRDALGGDEGFASTVKGG